MFNKKITKIKRFLCLMQVYGIMKLQKSTFSFGPQITLQQGDMDMKKRVTFLAALLVAACFGATVAMAEGSAKVTAQSGVMKVTAILRLCGPTPVALAIYC